MARSEELEEKAREPRAVKLKRRNHSFGFKVRGQVSEGGPRWLINGLEYRNLQTVSDVLPESAAEEGGVLAGDRILSINGKGVEGIEHDQFKELMKETGDEVELVVITPWEIKMLDVPTTVVIHKSDGSTLTISDTAMLGNHTIDEALNKEDTNTTVEIQVHKMTTEDEAINEEEESKNNEDSAAQDEKAENLINTFDGDDGHAENKKETDEDKESQLSKNPDDQEKDNDKCVDVINIISSEEESSIEVDENNEDGVEPDESKDDAGEIETVSTIKIEENLNDIVESPETSDIVNVESISLQDEVSMLNDVTDDTLEQNGKFESTSSHSPISSSFEAVSCSCANSAVKRKKKSKLKRHEKEVRRIQNEMRMHLSSIKRPKLNAFSPDIHNNLSPYYSNKGLKHNDDERRSWKFSQRPTSFSVLHPSEALRLESPLSKNDVSSWSSNLADKGRTCPVASEETSQIMRQDVLDMNRNFARKKFSKVDSSSPIFTDKKLQKLSMDFVNRNSHRTFIAYLGQQKIS